MTDAILTALVSQTEPFLHDGVVTGRWKTSDFLGQVRTIFIKDSNGLVNATLCDPVPGAQTIYSAVKQTICDGPDIRSDSRDNQGLPCDALSAAARIEAYRVKRLGTWTGLADAGARCANAPAVPEGDGCPP